MAIKVRSFAWLLLASACATTLAQSDPLSVPRGFLARGLTKEAETAVDDALRTDAGSVEGHYLRAEILFREQRAKESLAEFTAATKGRNPNAREFGMIASITS